MAILNSIQEKLEAFDYPVFYGTAAKLPKNAPWNYIVFSRDEFNPTGNKTGDANTYNVAIVCEEYIPEDLPRQVIDSVTEIAGMRISNDKCQYVYDVKPGTTDTVEMLVLRFTRPKKA